MADERHNHGEPCTTCSPTSTKAFAERVDAWESANKRLTEAAKNWPFIGLTDDGKPVHKEISPVDVLILAVWLHSGESYGE